MKDTAGPRKFSSRTLRWVSGLFVFELLTGLALTLNGSISGWIQAALLLHVVLGLVMLAAYLPYQLQHYREVAATPGAWRGWRMWVGSAAAAAIAVCVITGIWETGQAAMDYAVSPWLRRVHTWSGYAAGLLVGVHLGVALSRLASAAAGREFLKGSAAVCGLGLLVTGGLGLLPAGPRYQDEAPAGYSLKYGPEPFLPSNAATTTGGVIDARRMSGSKRCGACHEQIYKEWKASAHRWSSTDVFYRAVEDIMIKQEGHEATRYCAGCHDPVALLSGAVDAKGSLESHGSDEGASCLLCHGVIANQEKTKGNGNYLFQPPARYLFAHSEGGPGEWLNHFLIWAYPQPHARSLGPDFHASAEFCSVCHKQYIDKKINNFGWVQLQNQYDNWRNGRFHVKDHPEKTITCMECHMRLVPSEDPARGKPRDRARGDDGKHRSHRFIAANQAIPWLDKDAEQVRLTEEWLRGGTEVPEISHKWTRGAAIPLKIELLGSPVPGGRLKWRVVVTNNKVGHNFPTGPMDLIESWLEVKATDPSGRVLYHSGYLDKKNYVDKNAFFFRTLGIDRKGKPINRHNLWDMIGQKYKRAIFPGYSDAASYEAALPAETRGEVVLTARLRYRKFNQFITDLVLGDKKKIIMPVTDISSAELRVPVKAGPRPSGGR